MMAPIIPEILLQEANRAREIVGWVKPGAYREPLLWEGTVAGFVTPHTTAWGLTRAPVFVLPAYRRRGLAAAAYLAGGDVTCWDFAADYNLASQAMLARAGFTRWRRGNGGWFYRRLAVTP